MYYYTQQMPDIWLITSAKQWPWGTLDALGIFTMYLHAHKYPGFGSYPGFDHILDMVFVLGCSKNLIINAQTAHFNIIQN